MLGARIGQGLGELLGLLACTREGLYGWVHYSLSMAELYHNRLRSGYDLIAHILSRGGICG